MICKIQFTFILLSLAHLVGAQTAQSVFNVPDSTNVFRLEKFYELIIKNHPTAKQAALLSEVARQEIRLARGNFDPKLQSQLLSKTLNGKQYYDIFNMSMKFPSVLPIDPSIGIEQNSGAYLNPERYIDGEFDNRQLFAGISLPLGRGLITDERRATLKQAELFRELTEAEQVKIINKVLLDAAKVYWDWYYAYHNYRLLKRSVTVAEQIFKLVKTNYEFGEASAVDTVQAEITWQQRLIEQNEALLDFKNTGLGLSNMLWDSLNNPIELDLSWAPVMPQEPWILTNEDLNLLVENARSNHPDLRKLHVKLRQLEVEKKLALEYLKPELNVNYYALNQPFTPDGTVSFAVDDNFKFGLDFSFPLFLRKERSKVALTKLKISETKYEQSLTERQIVTSLAGIYNQLVNLQSIISTQQKMVAGYEKLLAAELLNLEQGEGDLFKINVQQEKLIIAQTKLLKLISENEKQKAHLYWAAGASRLGK